MTHGPGAPRSSRLLRLLRGLEIPALVLVVALILADALRGPAAAGMPARLGLFAASLALLVLTSRDRLRGRGRLLGALTLAVAGAGLSLWTELRVQQIRSGWEEGARASLEEQSDRIDREFATFAGRLAEPARILASQPFSGAYATELDPTSALFDLVDRLHHDAGLDDRFGIDLLDSLGRSVAWTGRTSILPSGVLHELYNRSEILLARQTRDGARLIYLSQIGDSGNVLVTEYRVQDRMQRQVADDFLPSLPRSMVRTPLRLEDLQSGDSDLDTFLAEQNDRYWSGPPEAPSLIFPLRAPSGALLAVVTLKALSQQAEIQRVHAVGAAWAGGPLIAAIGGLLALSLGWRRPLPRFLAASGCLWLLRLLMARTGFPQVAIDLPGFAETFTVPALRSLGRSPADFLLTGLTLLGQAALLGMWLRAAVGRWRARLPGPLAVPDGGLRPTALVAGLLLAGSTFLYGFLRLTRTVVNNSSIDLMHLRLADLDLETVLCHAGLLSVLLAGGLALAAVATSGACLLGWFRGEMPGSLGLPPGIRLRYVLLPATAVAAAISYGALVSATDDAVRDFYEYQLMPKVLEHRSLQEVALIRSMEALEHDPALAELLASRRPASYDEIAFDYWSRSDLARQGLNSSMEILDPAGNLLGEFSLDMPPVRRDRTHAGEGQEVEREILQSGDRVSEALHTSRTVRYRGRIVGLVLLHVLVVPENLPFLASSDPYTQYLRRPGGRPPEEIAAGMPILYAYDKDGTPLGGGTAPELPPLGDLAPPGEWHQVVSPSGAALEMLYARGEDGLYALGHAAPDPIARVGSFIRLLLLDLSLAVAGLLTLLLIAAMRHPERLHPSALIESLGRSYYRKLFATFVAASLLPLLALAVFLQGFVAREIRQEIVVKGTQSLDAAARILTRVSEEVADATIDDGVMDLVRNMIGMDLHLYVDDRLLATSRRELATAGLLPAKLDGTTYRNIYLEGRMISESTPPGADGKFELLASPVNLHQPLGRAVLGLHVVTGPGDVETQVSKVGEAILIATALLVVLLAGTGYLGARLISSPILQMVKATHRLARGELDTRVEVRTRDETASLARSFNEMSAALKAREDELRSNLLYMQKVLENATTGVVSLDGRGHVVTINAAAQRLLEAGGQALPGDDLGALLGSCEILSDLERAYGRARAEPEVEHALEVDLRESDEREKRRLRAVFVPFPLENDGPGQILLLEDVTDMVRSNKLSAWAEMARQIAHEIKNPLTPIQLAVGHLRRVYRRTPAALAGEGGRFGETLEECLEIILEQVQQLRRISGEFSTYARIPEIRRQLTSPAELIANVLRPYAGSLPEEVQVEQRVDPALPPVPLDPDLMRRTLVNLVENSLQAMPQGGRLSVTAARADRNGGSWLEIAVSDTGVGVDEENLERLFEPYFSTKGTGTGLGLAIARRAVEEHGGEIHAESHGGAGTTFRIWLPMGPRPSEGRG